MREIVPAILPKSYEDLKNKIALVRNLSAFVQIDICDGNFVHNLSWPFLSRSTSSKEIDLDFHFQKILSETEGMPFWQDISFEIDLMVMDAVQNFDLYTKLGAQRIVFHFESFKDPVDFENFLEGIDNYTREMMQIGLALNMETSIEKIFSLINKVDFIQLMGIDKIGFQGEKFDLKVLEKIKELKEKFPDIIISIDGGVNLEDAAELLEAGADRLIVGSAIFNSVDALENLNELKNLVAQYD